VCECLRHWSESPYTGHGVNGTIPGSTGWLSSTFQLGPHGLCPIRRRHSKHFPFRRPPAAVTSETLSENGVWAPGSKQLAVSSDSRPRPRHGGYRWRRRIDELVDLFLLPAIKAGLLNMLRRPSWWSSTLSHYWSYCQQACRSQFHSSVTMMSTMGNGHQEYGPDCRVPMQRVPRSRLVWSRLPPPGAC